MQKSATKSQFTHCKSKGFPNEFDGCKKLHKVVSSPHTKKERTVVLMLEYSKFWLMWILGYVDRSDLNLSVRGK